MLEEFWARGSGMAAQGFETSGLRLAATRRSLALAFRRPTTQAAKVLNQLNNYWHFARDGGHICTVVLSWAKDSQQTMSCNVRVA